MKVLLKTKYEKLNLQHSQSDTVQVLHYIMYVDSLPHIFDEKRFSKEDTKAALHWLG